MKVYYFFVLLGAGTVYSQGGIVGKYHQGKEVERAELIAAIKRQNTLLTSSEASIGLYKKDLINAAFFASYLYADSLLYKQLVAGTVDKTMRAIIEDIDGLIAVLERTKASEDRFEERMAFAAYQGESSMSKGRKKRVMFNPLRRYLNTHHNVDSVMNREVLSALALRWGWDRLSCWAEQAMVVRSPSLIGKLVDSEEGSAHDNAYVYEGDNLVTAQYAPYSATTAVKAVAFIMSPFTVLRASLRTGHTSYRVGKLAFYNRILGTGLSEKLFSQGVRTLLECIELGGAVSFFNEANRYHWIGFVVERRYKLLRLLYAYRYVLEDPTGEEAHVKLIEDEIRDFVERGYTRTSWLPGVALRQWWSSQGRSSANMGGWLRYATLAILGLKSAHWIYNMIEQP